MTKPVLVPPATLRFKRFNAFLGALFCLSLVYSLDTQASQCTLHFSALTPTEKLSWQKSGYRLVQIPNFENLTAPELSALLKDHHYGIYRKGKKNEVRFSLTNGKAVKNWKPLGMKAPNPNEVVGPAYNCSLMSKRLQFFKESRRAIEEMALILTGQKSKRPLGEIILDIERSFFVHKGQLRYEATNAKQRYAEILKNVKPHSKSEDFFSSWLKVRKYIFDKSSENIEYCRDLTSMTEAMVDSCTNCVGETYLLAALFMDGGFTSPKGWSLGAQLFSDHLRPVLYNESLKKAYDMTTGRFEDFQASIFNIEQLFKSLWKGHSALRFDGEISKILSISPKYIYTDLACLNPLSYQVRPEFRPSDFNGLKACGRFTDQEVPERASNQNKTEDFKEEDDKEKDGDEGIASAIAQKLKSAFGNGSSWLGIFGNNGGVFEDNAEYLKTIAETLNPEEKAALLQSVAQKGFTPEAVKLFSIGTLVDGLGYTYLRHLDKFNLPGQKWSFDKTLRLPFLIDLVDRKNRVSQHQDFNVRNYSNIVVDIYDANLFERLKPLTQVERIRVLIAHEAEKVNSNSKEVISHFPKVSSEKNLVPTLLRLPNAELFASLNSIESLIPLLGGDAGSFYLSDGKYTRLDNNPLAEAVSKAILDSLNGEFLELKDRHVDVSKFFREKPVEILKQLESLPNVNFMLGETLYTLRRLHLQAKHLESAALGKAARFDSDSNSTVFGLLASTLTHDTYFFTVEPDKEEALEYRPYYPRKVSDPLIRDLKNIKSQMRLPEIQLPKFNLSGVCKPGQDGFHEFPNGSNSIGIVVECRSGKGSLVEPDSKKGEDQTSQTGILNGSEDPTAMDTQDATQGNSKFAQEGLINEETLGEENEGQLPLDRPMSEEEMAIQKMKQAQIIQRGRKTEGDSFSIDPRQEVHLKPETWKFLLQYGRLSSMGGSEGVGYLKVLLHHTYRSGLKAIFSSELFKYDGYKLITPFDYETTHLEIEGIRLRQLSMDFQLCKDEGCKREVVKKVLSYGRKSESTNLAKLLNKAYFKVAVNGLSNPKYGYTVFNIGGEQKSLEENWEAVRMSIFENDPTRSNGVFLPFIFKDPTGASFSVLPSNRRSIFADPAKDILLLDFSNYLLGSNMLERYLLPKELQSVNLDKISEMGIESLNLNTYYDVTFHFLREDDSQMAKALGVVEADGDLIKVLSLEGDRKVDEDFLYKLFTRYLSGSETRP